MALFKCKMCGGSLDIAAGKTVIECEYCGTQQTLPKLDDEKRANLYDRANHFRRNNEFDKAMSIYEQILNEDNTDAEAYWSIVLCRYGIEYVEDPATHQRVPTVNRAQYTSILADEDYKAALANADTYQKGIYEQEARAIDEIQKNILALAQKEEPFDVFICYKESDQNGKRTRDSVIANDIYHQLTNEGFKVFYAAITLEGKLGSAYEPIIFSALNSAKVMLVIGTKPEYFNAVWVKNEWSRYLKLIQKDHTKLLIPCYRDMDAYDLPDEFSHLQAQDMNKIGFINDIIRGIKKVIPKDESQALDANSQTRVNAPVSKQQVNSVASAPQKSNKKRFAILAAIVAAVIVVAISVVLGRTIGKSASGSPDTSTDETPDTSEEQTSGKSTEEIMREAEQYYLDGNAAKAAEILASYNIKNDTATAYEYVAKGKYVEAVELGLVHMVIPSGVTAIPVNAFRECNSLKSIVIPDSVTRIGQGAFYCCGNLDSVSLGNGVQTIEKAAFYNCASLSQISIPNSVTSIGYGAFWFCSNLVSVTFETNSQLMSLDHLVFSCCTRLVGITIPASVTSMGANVFQTCSSLTSIVFEDTTTWFRYRYESDWVAKTNGIETVLTDASTNAQYFTSMCPAYFWYKK